MTSDRPEPVHAVRVRLHDQPGAGLYMLAPPSLIDRLRRDAEGSGDQVDDLGPLPLTVDRPGVLVTFGVKQHGEWVSVTPGMEQVALAVADLERGQN